MSERQRLPDERQGITHKFTIDGVKGYLTVGLYDDGRVGEIFAKMDRQGSQVSGFVDAWAIAVSMLLQTGTPVEKIVEKFRGARFDPSGCTDNPQIVFAKSPIDYIVRWLDAQFLSSKSCERCGRRDGVFLAGGRSFCEQCRSGKRMVK